MRPRQPTASVALTFQSDGPDAEKQGDIVSLGYDSGTGAKRLICRSDGCVGQLKAKLSKLKKELLTPSGGGGGGGSKDCTHG